MSGPPKEAAVVVGAEWVNPELGEEALGGDKVANGVGDGDAAHGAGASVVEAAWTVVEVLAQAPNLQAIEEDAKDQGHVDATFDLVVRARVRNSSSKGTHFYLMSTRSLGAQMARSHGRVGEGADRRGMPQREFWLIPVLQCP